jgi:predicted glycoside hydrolase/deacetylase ChbG (UPF0249 family)
MKETLELCARHKLPFRFPKSLENVKQIARMETLPEELIKAHEQIVATAQTLGIKLIDYLLTNTTPFSELTSYEKLKSVYFRLISGLPEGVSEIFLHPSPENSPVGANNPVWFARVWEYKLLLDDDLRHLIEKEDIKLITYPEIP